MITTTECRKVMDMVEIEMTDKELARNNKETQTLSNKDVVNNDPEKGQCNVLHISDDLQTCETDSLLQNQTTTNENQENTSRTRIFPYLYSIFASWLEEVADQPRARSFV